MFARPPGPMCGCEQAARQINSPPAGAAVRNREPVTLHLSADCGRSWPSVLPRLMNGPEGHVLRCRRLVEKLKRGEWAEISGCGPGRERPHHFLRWRHLQRL